MSGFPNVPNVPGVPPLLRGPITSVLGLGLFDSDTVSGFLGIGGPPWGIYLKNKSIIDSDNVVSVEYRQEWRIADFPIEDGGFVAYDKVSTPFDVRVRFSAGGSTDNRQAFLESIAKIAGDLNLYDVVTPEAVYQDVNITRYDYKREAMNGVGLIVVDVWCVEIRVVDSEIFAQVKAPSAASTTSTGPVQSITPTTPAQRASANALIEQV